MLQKYRLITKVNEQLQNSIPNRRRRVSRLLTFLLFFYLLANVSVLEYFCGNPELGIVSYRQAVTIEKLPTENEKTVFVTFSADDYNSSHQDQKPDIPLDGDDSFCCSSHATISYNYLVVSLMPVIHQQQSSPVFSNSQNHSDWHLPPSYRPPRIA